MANDNDNPISNHENRVHPRIEIENRSQEVHQELSLSEITAIAVRNWPLFLVLFVLTSILGLSFYKWNNPYIAKTKIIINDNQNSQLQSFSLNLAGHVKTNEAKKTNSVAQKNIEFFKTTDFFEKIILASLNPQLNKQLTVAEKKGHQAFKDEIIQDRNLLDESAKIEIYQTLDSLLLFKVKSDFEIEIVTSSNNKELALYLTNLVSKISLDFLKMKDSQEIQVINDLILKEKQLVDTELAELNKKMANFNDKPENLIALSSRDRVGEYLSELMVRKNETVLKISENNKIIQTLSSGKDGLRESQLYGSNGRIQSLRLENDLLKAKLGQIQTAIDRVSSDAKGMPYAAQVYEELKKRADMQLERFKSLSENLAKVEALKVSMANKYELFEKARFDQVRPSISLSVVLFLSLIFSQVLGSLIIYLRAIWNSNLVTAEATRNVVVLDSHTLDPRVIIENSKIRFRLRNSNLDDPENGQSKKLGFNFRAKDQNG